MSISPVILAFFEGKQDWTSCCSPETMRILEEAHNSGELSKESPDNSADDCYSRFKVFSWNQVIQCELERRALKAKNRKS